jgi:flagellar hook-length control protein FliK
MLTWRELCCASLPPAARRLSDEDTMVASASVSVTTAIQPASPRAAGSDARSSGDAGRAFDSHLDAARQQHDDSPAATASPASRPKDSGQAPADAASPDSAVQADAAKASGAAGKSADDSTGKADEKSDDKATAASDGVAAGLAGALLALLGQALPTGASAAAGGAAKVLSASVLKSTGGKALAVTDSMTAGVKDADASSTAANAAVPPSTTPTATPQAAISAAMDAALPASTAHKDDELASIKDLGAAALSLPQPGNPVMTTAPHALQIASPAGTPAFAQELGQQVAWLGGQDIKEARIRLHPEDMGQLDVKVSVQHNNQVDVTFAVQHPQAVHAVQQTLSQLDSMLAQHGLSLGHADVSQRQQGGHGRGGSTGEGATASVDALDDVAGTPSPQVSALGLLDTFA